MSRADAERPHEAAEVTTLTSISPRAGALIVREEALVEAATSPDAVLPADAGLRIA